MAENINYLKGYDYCKYEFMNAYNPYNCIILDFDEM